MAIKITRAPEIGIGQKTPGAIAEGVARPVTPVDTGMGLEIAQAVTKVAGVAYSSYRTQQEKAAEAAEKDRLKLQKAAALETKNTANITMANLFGKMTEVTDVITNSDLPVGIATESLNNELNQIESDFRSKIPPELQDAFLPRLINESTSAKSRFATFTAKKAKDQALAGGSQMIGQIIQAASANPEMSSGYKKSIGELVNSLPMDELKKTNLKNKKYAEIDSNAVAQRMTERGGTEFRTDLDPLIGDLKATDTEGNYLNYKDLPADARISYIDQAERARIVDNNAKEQLFKNQTKSAVARYKDLVLAGFPIPPEQELVLAQMVKGTAFEKEFNDIKNEGSSLEFMAKKYAEAPLEYGAARMGLTVKPLDMTNPDGLIDQLQSRVEVGRIIQASIGGSFTPILMTGEVKQVGELMTTDMNAAIKLMSDVTSVVGHDMANGIAMQMSVKDPQKATILRAVAEGDVGKAMALAEGQRLISTKAIKMPKPLDSSEWFWDKAGLALAAYPNNGKEAFDAYLSMYAYNAQETGVQDGELDYDLAMDAFEKTVGQIDSINGFRTIIQDGITESSLKDGIKRIRGAFVQAQGGIVGYKDHAEAARDIREDGQFYSAGPNIYRVMLNGKVVMTPRGPLQFDVSGIKDKQSNVVPIPNKEEIDAAAVLGYGLFNFGE